MNAEELRDYCLAKKGVTESFPFDDKVLVFKVMNKMFAIANIESFDSVNLKCDPEEAIRLREEYPAIKPGYHMSKVHWNTVFLNENLSHQLVCKLIDDSYDLVASKLTKKEKAELSLL